MVTEHFYLEVHSDPVDSICWDLLLRAAAVGESAEDVQSACALLLADGRWFFLQGKKINKKQNHTLLAFTLKKIFFKIDFEREGEWERNIDRRKTSTGCLLRAPH